MSPLLSALWISNDSWESTIGGREGNIIVTPVAASICGGYHNVIGGDSDGSTIGGGLFNQITNGGCATIPGGYQNFATTKAFAAGHRAKARSSGMFVWADS